MQQQQYSLHGKSKPLTQIPSSEKKKKKSYAGVPSPQKKRREAVELESFFQRIKSCVDLMASPSRSRDEIRNKLKMGRRAQEVLNAQEERLAKGKALSPVDKIGK